MELNLIGAGISSDFTSSTAEILKSCERIYVERYTGFISDESIKQLAYEAKKEIVELKREKVESDFLIKEAKQAKVALIVCGDPLTATTHISLVIDAKKAGIIVKIIHNSSIYAAAAGKAGLQIYRFGKIATLVNPHPNYSPTSSFEVIHENLSRNLHTLVLLDTEPKPMEAKLALELLEKNDFGQHKIVVLSCIGYANEKVSYGDLAELKKRDLGKPLFCLIIPGKLHPLEEEYLNSIC